MTTLFIILILLASVILSVIVLIQNPKGGGLAGNIAGFSSQFMGVKQTNDVLERGTWIFAGVIAVLCMLSSFFVSNASSTLPDRVKDATGASVPAQQQPEPGSNTLQLNPTPAVPDSPGK